MSEAEDTLAADTLPPPPPPPDTPLINSHYLSYLGSNLNMGVGKSQTCPLFLDALLIFGSTIYKELHEQERSIYNILYMQLKIIFYHPNE